GVPDCSEYQGVGLWFPTFLAVHHSRSEQSHQEQERPGYPVTRPDDSPSPQRSSSSSASSLTAASSSSSSSSISSSPTFFSSMGFTVITSKNGAHSGPDTTGPSSPSSPSMSKSVSHSGQYAIAFINVRAPPVIFRFFVSKRSSEIRRKFCI